jgi:hypothetical protein
MLHFLFTGVYLAKKENPIKVGETIRINASSFIDTRIDWKTNPKVENGVWLSNRPSILRQYYKPGQ